MIEFSRAMLTHFAVHFVGNKGLGEEVMPASSLLDFPDDFVKETVLRYCLRPFKGDVYYQFKGKIDVSLDSVANICEDIFVNRSMFLFDTGKIAKHLWNQSMHPKIKGGYLYTAYFKDVICDGELVDAIGLFKSERPSTYLKTIHNTDEISIDTDSGFDIDNLDKGCLIFNTQKDSGYKLSIIDNNNKVAECQIYWLEDFLNAKILQNAFFYTQNFIDLTRTFAAAILTTNNGVDALKGEEFVSNSLRYLNEHTYFVRDGFEKEVLAPMQEKIEGLVQDFNEFEEQHRKTMDLPKPPAEFDVSPTSLKKNKKHMRAVVKLDKNFHVYVHSNYDYIEEGFDEKRGLKYMKLFYVNKDV